MDRLFETPIPEQQKATTAGRHAHRDPARDQAVSEFLARWAPDGDAELLSEMMITICRLGHDRAGRGELKILNSALKELRYAFKLFAPYEHVRKVSIFGSARTPEDHPDYKAAVRFAERMREEKWMVITGAGDGIMRAGHGGAGPEASFGVAIRLPFEQKTNTIIAADAKLVNFKYFFTRKLMFVKEASAIALFPGGFGTQDEGFEALTLVQTGKSPIMPIVLIDSPGGTYWQHWRTYIAAELLRTNMIGPEDMHLFYVTDDADAAVREITTFYKRYHSMRYVRDTLVLRMNTPIDNGLLAELNDDFKDILVDGVITQVLHPLPEEGDHYADKPRLLMPFNKRSIGRLRMLINAINKAG